MWVYQLASPWYCCSSISRQWSCNGWQGQQGRHPSMWCTFVLLRPLRWLQSTGDVNMVNTRRLAVRPEASAPLHLRILAWCLQDLHLSRPRGRRVASDLLRPRPLQPSMLSLPCSMAGSGHAGASANYARCRGLRGSVCGCLWQRRSRTVRHCPSGGPALSERRYLSVARCPAGSLPGTPMGRSGACPQPRRPPRHCRPVQGIH